MPNGARFRRDSSSSRGASRTPTSWPSRPKSSGPQQTWLPELNRVDRCETCHLGIDDPAFASAPAPFTTHPGAWLTTHPTARFGCTVCHGGQGRATDYVNAAHRPQPFVLRPMSPLETIEANCGACHVSLDPPDAPRLAEGRQLIVSAGCVSCHEIPGFEGVTFSGPALDSIGYTARREAQADVGAWRPTTIAQRRGRRARRVFVRRGCHELSSRSPACRDTGQVSAPSLAGVAGPRPRTSSPTGRHARATHGRQLHLPQDCSQPEALLGAPSLMPTFAFTPGTGGDDHRGARQPPQGRTCPASRVVTESAAAARIGPRGPFGELVTRYRCLSCHRIGGVRRRPVHRARSTASAASSSTTTSSTIC